MQEEGFTLVNNPELTTYIAPNGTSAIDLIFYRGEGIKIQGQIGLWSTDAALIRKHIPIKTSLLIKNQMKKEIHLTNQTSISRKLNKILLEDQTQLINDIIDKIENEDLSSALDSIQEVITKSQTRIPTRKAKPWFDKECYSQRRKTMDSLHVAKQDHTESNLRKHAECKKEYKNLIKHKKAEHREKLAKTEAEEALAATIHSD